MGATTLVLMGKTGNGKSSTGNSILRRNEFASKRSGKSVTKECKLGQSKWKDGRTINVVDTPGLFDTTSTKEYVDREIVKCIDLAKDGVHAFILVLSVKNRFTQEEANVLDNLQMLFGPNIIDYMIVLFTGGDEFDNDEGFTLEDYLNDCPVDLTKVIRRCNSRYAVFDNKTKSERKKEDQITKLLQIVDHNIAQNGNRPYSNELFEKAKSMASQMYHIRDKDKIYEDQIKLLNEMMKKNMEEMEERTKAMIKGYEERLKSAKSDENEALETSRMLRRQNLRYREEIEDLYDDLARYRRRRSEPKDDGRCWPF